MAAFGSESSAGDLSARDRDKFKERAGDAVEAAKEARFVRWLAENGAKFADRVELRSYDAEVRGVHAARDVGSEEILIEVPLKCLITVEMGKATSVGRAVLEAELELDAPKHVFLMLFLIAQHSRQFEALPSRLHAGRLVELRSCSTVGCQDEWDTTPREIPERIET